MKKQDEQALINGLKNQENWAFREFYQEGFRRVQPVLYKMGADINEIKDCLDLCIIKVVEQLSKPKNIQNIYAYLYFTVSNLFKAERRKQQKNPQVELTDTLIRETPGEEELDEEEIRKEEAKMYHRKKEFNDCFEKLSIRDQTILLAVHEKTKITNIELAEMFEETIEYVGVIKYRSTIKLKICLGLISPPKTK